MAKVWFHSKQNRFLRLCSRTVLTCRRQLVVIYSWLTAVIHLYPSLLQCITGRKLLARSTAGAMTNWFSDSVNTQCTASHPMSLFSLALGTPCADGVGLGSSIGASAQQENQENRWRQSTKSMDSDCHCPPNSPEWKYDTGGRTGMEHPPGPLPLCTISPAVFQQGVRWDSFV